MYTSELARHQNRIVLFRYNFDLNRIFGVVNTSVKNRFLFVDFEVQKIFFGLKGPFEVYRPLDVVGLPSEYCPMPKKHKYLDFLLVV